MKKKLLAMLLVVSLIASLSVTAFAGNLDEKEAINYVSLGASNVNGYGMHGYLDEDVYEYPLLKETANIYGYKQDTPGSYPVLIKEYFEDQGCDVNLSQMAISSMRAEEVRFLLDDSYEGDAYTDWRFCDIPGYDARDSHNWFYLAGKLEWEAQGNHGIPTQEQSVVALRKAYRDAIAEADLITVDIGINNFGVYASNQIVSNMYENDMNTIDPELAAIYAEGKAYVMEVLQEKAGDLLEIMPVETLEHMADTMAYALVGFCLSFDAVMEQIYELNPDATVVVASIQNLMYGLYAEMEGIDQALPFGEIFGALINAANIYTATISPYCDMYAYADVRKAGHVEFFSDELLTYDGDPSTLSQDMKDCFDVYDNDLYIKSRVQQLLAKQLYGDRLLDISAAEAMGGDIANNLEHFAIAYQNDLLRIPDLRNITLKQFFDAGAAGQLPDVAQPYYDGYVVALNTAYDVMAEIMQAGLELDTLDASAFGENFGPVEDALLGAFFGTLEDAVMKSIADPTFVFDLDDYYPDGIYKTLAARAELDEGFVNTVAVMGIRTGIGNSFYGHPNGNGQIELKDAILAALEDGTTGKDVAIDELLKAAEDLSAFVAEYYDEAYAYAYAEAKAAGCIDNAIAGIDAAIDELQSIDLSDTEITAEFQAEVAEEIEEMIETLEAAKALILEADVLDQASLDALMAMLEEAGEAAAHLEDLLLQAGHDIDRLVIIPALQEACRILHEEVIPQIEHQLQIAAIRLMEQIEEAYGAFVDAFVNEFLPEADAWLYDWFYNNPDKVIAFFNEYGDEIVDLIEENQDAIKNVLGYIALEYGEDMVVFVLNNPETVFSDMVAWYDEYGYRVWPMIDVYLEELGVYDAIEETAKDTIEKIEKALDELGIEIQKEIQDKIDEIKAMIEGEIKATIEEIEKAIDELIAMIEEMLYDATHGEYTVTAGSYYVAIDEMYAEGEGYADKLAEHLGIAYNEINELDEDEIAKADLITVRYNNEPMIGVMIEDAKDYKTVEAKDWSVYVGAVGAEYVQQALAEVKAMLAEQDLGTMGDMALVAVESYAYEYVGHMISYIQDLETISEINPDALVISVGMNNALSDVVLTLDEEEIALGEYIQYVVDAANLEAFVYVLVTGNAIYVDAPAVETEFDAEESADVMDFILNLIDEESREVLLANDEGHEYIKEQILGALTITYEGLLGDANNDGVVDYVDAIYVLEYDAKLRAADELAYSLCDVNGDGAVDYVDAIFILEYDAKLITKFPAAV